MIMSPWRMRLMSWLCSPCTPVMICDEMIFGFSRSSA